MKGKQDNGEREKHNTNKLVIGTIIQWHTGTMLRNPQIFHINFLKSIHLRKMGGPVARIQKCVLIILIT